MRKIFLLLLIVIMNFSLWGVHVDIPQTKELVEYQQSDRGSISIEFNLDGYEREEITKDGTKYTRISYPQEGKLLDVGLPDLPVFTRLIAIPDQGTPVLTISAENSFIEKNVLIYPQEKILLESEKEQDLFTIDSEYYLQGNIYPAAIAQLGKPAIMRDIRLVKVTFCPFQYNPLKKELVIHDNIRLEINTEGQGGINAKTSDRPHSRVFSNIYSSIVLNYNEVCNLRDDFQRPSILFIYPLNNNVADNLEYLMDWKNKKGFEVSSVNTTQTGTSTSQIKNYIQNAYDNWENPPDYVVLVGDVSGLITIPTYYENWSSQQGAGDHPYSLLAGNDVLADVIIGRLAVNTINELQTVITKSINYERDPYMDDPDWFEEAILFSYGGPGKIATCETVEEYITIHNPEYSFSEIYYSNWIYSLDQALNNGASYLCWRSQGVDSGWNNNNINALNNGWMLSFGVLITCFTGDMNGNCLGETFLRAGSSTVPKGGIAAIGTSTGMTSGCFNNCVTEGVFYGIFIDDISTTGGSLVRGKLNLYQQYPNNPDNHVNCWSHCNTLFGDPSIDLWTGTPQPMMINYPEVIAYGTEYMEVGITDEAGIPLKDAWVTARGANDFYQTGYSDFQGKFYLDLEGITTNEEYEITITSHNKIPHEGEFTVNQAEYNPGIAQISYLDLDDGIPNPGEEISLEFTIMNYGYNDLIDLNAELVSMDNNISIVTSSTDLGDITSGNQVVNSDLAIYIDPATPGGTISQLNLILTSNSETWEIPVFIDIYGALLNIDSYVAQNANGILDPGESADIYFVIENLGQISAISIYGELECLNNRISIQDSIGFFGNIAPDDTAYNFSNTFEITASSSIIPGTQIPVNINFTNEDGFNATCSYLIQIGTVTEEDPLGPDEYGYYCYDDDDTAYENCPTYDWVEINNIGDDLNIYTVGDSADITDVILPADFSLVFYGEEYDLITIATAGWISPGGSTAAAFMNWSIPGTGGPSPMIAAFWDDINNGYQGDVFTYYNNSQHYFIVEWDRMRNEHNNEIETFQIILYDPNFYPTTTGDSKIKIQYKDVANTNIGEYPYHGANHGQYCTVGLEDHSSTIGLQYTYNNSYSLAAKPLQDQMALLFTTPSIPPDGPFLTIMDYSAYAGEDQYIEAGEDAVISLTLENIGEDDANNVQLTISEDDEYIDIIDGTDSCSIVAANDMVTISDAFTISVSDNVPDYYTFTLNVNITSDEDSWNQSIALTAYQANTFAVFPESIEHELQWGNSDSTSFELTNIGLKGKNWLLK